MELTRRAFLLRLAAVGAGAVALAKLPFTPQPVQKVLGGPLTFAGVPVVMNRDCPDGRVYIICHSTVREEYVRLLYSDRRYCGSDLLRG